MSVCPMQQQVKNMFNPLNNQQYEQATQQNTWRPNTKDSQLQTVTKDQSMIVMSDEAQPTVSASIAKQGSQEQGNQITQQ